jgi:peptide/nickel transport system ATP-binding protein
MAFREALERDALPLDRIRESLDDPSDRDALAAAIHNEYFSTELSGENAATLDSALEDIAGGNHETAIETLRERFESVCEITPKSIEAETDWHVACHQYYDHDRQVTEDHAITTD